MVEAVPDAVLAAREVVKRFPPRGEAWRRRGDGHLALAGVSVRLGRGEVLGIVGRSGSGKSTLLRILAGLESPDAGDVLFEGTPLAGMEETRLRVVRRRLQLIFQDSAAALSPRLSVSALVAEPLVVHRLTPRRERRQRVVDLLSAVGLTAGESLLARRAHELSGGERQRVAIARALACEPEVVLLDEPVSALDISVRSQVLNLLGDLHVRFGIPMILVSHDLTVVATMADRIAVVDRGRVVEEGATRTLLAAPASDVAKELVVAARAVTAARETCGSKNPYSASEG